MQPGGCRSIDVMKKLVPSIALALVLAACGAGDDAQVASLQDSSATTSTTSAAQSADSEQAVLEFAQCMRDNGVEDFPDPELDSNGNLRLFGPGADRDQLGADRDTLEAAFEECGGIVEGLIQDVFRNIDQSEFQDAFLEFAQCMRDNGIDMPDPDFSEGFGPGAGGRGGLFGDIDPNDPVFQQAAEECQSVFEGTFGPGGPFGGPGAGAPGGDGS